MVYYFAMFHWIKQINVKKKLKNSTVISVFWKWSSSRFSLTVSVTLWNLPNSFIKWKRCPVVSLSLHFFYFLRLPYVQQSFFLLTWTITFVSPTTPKGSNKKKAFFGLNSDCSISVFLVYQFDLYCKLKKNK